MQGDVVYWIFMTYIHIYSPPKWLNPGYGYHGSVSTAVYSFSSGRGGRGFQGIVRCWWICATLLSFFLSLMSLSDRRMPPFFSGRGQRGFLTRIFEAETESIDNFGDNFFPASNTSELRRNVDETSILNEFFHRFDLRIPLDELLAASRTRYVKVKKLPVTRVHGWLRIVVVPGIY